MRERVSEKQMTDANAPLMELGKGFSGHATPTPPKRRQVGWLSGEAGQRWERWDQGPPVPEAVYSDLVVSHLKLFMANIYGPPLPIFQSEDEGGCSGFGSHVRLQWPGPASAR